MLEAAGMTSRSDGGAALAQPRGGGSRFDFACFAAFALGSLGLAIWTAQAVLTASGGELGAPLDDSYIHFQFAKSFARFRPFEYVPGLARVPGATSILWPALLTPALWLGASGSGLVKLTWLLGFGSLFGQACEVYLSGKRFLHRSLAFAGGLLVLAFSANTWFAASAMEVVPLGYVLLRTARRSAEFLEAPACAWRRRELVLLAFVAALLRPEGALAALCAGTVLALRRRGSAVAALLSPLSVLLLNWLFTGSATQTTTLAKWLPTNPYYHGRLLSSVLGNVELFYGTLLNGQQWSWTFIPEGYRLVGLASLPALWLAAERGRARGHAACLCLVGLGILLPATYETFLVNRLRYLWPFSGPWLLGLAALGQLLAMPLRRWRGWLVSAGLVVPGLAGYGFVKLLPISVGDVAQSAAAITAQQVALGRWAAAELPKTAKIGVNDAGAISFYSERQTFDVVGLTTRGEARYWVGGAGSRFEHYERLPRGELPSHFIVYPEWFAIPNLLGECLYERRVEGATILGGPVMVACRADYSSLGSGAEPLVETGARAKLDELDVADLESEAAHDYQLYGALSQDNLVESSFGHVDGGRARRNLEAFRLVVEADGLLVLRLSTDAATRLELFVEQARAASVEVEPGAFRELILPLPAVGARGRKALSLRSSEGITLLHYWSYGRML